MAISSFSPSSVVVAPPPGWFRATKPFDLNRNVKKLKNKKKDRRTGGIEQGDVRDADSHPWKIASSFHAGEETYSPGFFLICDAEELKREAEPLSPARSTRAARAE